MARHPFRVHERPNNDFIEDEERVSRGHEPLPEPPHWPLKDPADPTPSPLSPNGQTLGVNFTGATLADCQAYPPDSMGTVGPSQFIVAVNGRVRSFNKTTGVADGVINVDTDVFFNSVMTPPVTNNFTSDPRIRYDRLSTRWFIIMIDVPGKNGTIPDRVMIAVSDGPIITPSSVWTFFYFQHDLIGANDDAGKFADYPTLGIDANALYIGVNVFQGRGPGAVFSNTTGFIVRKSSILGAGPIVVTAFRSLIPKGNSGGPYTPHGVDNYNPGATEGYFIGVNSRFYGQLTLVRVSNPGGTPSISANISISLPSLNGPTINVPHLGNTGGTAGYLDGLDYRLLAAHFRNGQIWTTETMAVDNNGTRNATATRDGVRWYVVSGVPTGQTPTVAQWGLVYQPSPSNTSDQRSYWMGTIMVSGQGHAAMGFSTAGANEYANAATVGRLTNDPSGTMRTPVLYTSANSAYNPVDSMGAPINRWGDYSYTSLDPNDDMTMWTIQEFCNAPNSYGVQVVRLLAPGPALPTNCTPGSIAAGASNVNVVVSGLSDGETGFFDPGNGFSNRLAAIVNGGGVTINSISYSNPTKFTINISVASGAAAGSRSLTVTNPDGQTITSASGLLTVTGGGATNSAPSLTAISNKTVNEGTLLTFTNTATDPNGDALTYSLDPGAPAGAAVNATNGVFTWTPTEAQGPGTNSVTVRVRDNGSPNLSDSKTFTITINELNSAPSLAAVANRTIHQGSTVTFTNVATDPDIPTNALAFSLSAPIPPGASINSSSGVFVWTPDVSFVNTTNPLKVILTDNGVPALSATQSFSVTVVSRPIIQSIAVSNAVASFAWSSISGQVYQPQFRSNFGSLWQNLGSPIMATGTVATKNDGLGEAQKFYRVQVLP